jgi:hypothetical protein
MKVVCLDSGSYWLTPGKIYDAEPYLKKFDKKLFDWVITNDIGSRHAVEGHLFIPIDEQRELRLIELGI